MRRVVLVMVISGFAISMLAGCATWSGGAVSPALAMKKRTLKPFRSEQDLTQFLRKIALEQKRDRPRGEAFNLAAPTPASPLKKSVVSDESVTNVQHAGVDEGGIVKLHGEYLIVLRRGRLFTVAINDNEMKQISTVDAFGPDIDPRWAWYDEMLVSGETIAVIGYSYERGGTEVGLFKIDSKGNLAYQSTYHLRSNDYYSSRNYASRLIGSKLIFYTPLYLSPETEDLFGQFPAVRKWEKDVKESDFRRIVKATQVYRVEQQQPSTDLALHTVTSCDLDQPEMSCEATAVMGAPGRVFYVSLESVYVWTTEWIWNGRLAQSMLYRLPFDGSGPSALKVSGSPVDQFSFLESEDQHLNVLVRADAPGDGMWGAEFAAGDVALLRVPLNRFSNGTDAAPASSYRKLIKPEGYSFQNRFIGDYLLYGTGDGWGHRKGRTSAYIYLAPWAGGQTVELAVAHSVDRIEAMGDGAVVIGTEGKNLTFTAVRLGESPTVAYSYTRKDASQGELRSHGFFYKPDGPETGVLGLPIRGAGRPGYEHLFKESASVLFLRNDSANMAELGELVSGTKTVNDACRASCVDWYGNARPLFVRGRIFALLGYELVEGRLIDGRMIEVQRTNYLDLRKAPATDG